MLPENVCRRVLTMGCTYVSPRGGIAQVLNTYSLALFRPFNFITTTRGGSGLIKLLCLVEAWFRLVYCCLIKDIAIIHIHGASSNSFWRKRVFIYTAKFLGKKVVYHIHGGGFMSFSIAHREAVAKVLRKVDVVVALSRSWKQFFEYEFHSSNVVVIPNIIAYPQFIPRSISFAKVRVEALFLGLLDRNKGVFNILEMINQHQEELRGKFLLHIGGNGKTEEVKRLIAKYGIGDIVQFEGWVKGEKKIELLSRSDFYLLPSYKEGLPISILEAMSYRLPIVASPVGGIPEIVEDGVNGFLVQPGDNDNLYQVVSRLIENSLQRKSMGERSWEKVQPYLPSAVESKLMAVYSSLLDSKSKV